MKRVASKNMHAVISVDGGTAPPELKTIQSSPFSTSSCGQGVGVFDRRAVDAEMKIVWTHRPSDFGKPEYGVRRAKAIEKHLSAII
jgi:hypothetical protein